MSVSSEFGILRINPKKVSTSQPKNYKLSADQLKFYVDNGYLVIRGLIDLDTLNACRERFLKIANREIDRGHITVVKEPGLQEKGAKGEDLLNKLQEIAYDDVFSTYIEHPVLLDVVSQIIGDDNILAIHSMFINKPPGSSRHPPHQDLYYFPFRPSSRIVAAWSAVDNVNINNGALWVIPRSHKEGKMYDHGNLPDANKMYHGIQSESSIAPDNLRVTVEMSPGDTIFFHPLIVHGSGPNTTTRHRKSLTVHYISSSCHVVPVEGTTQQLIKDEIEAETRRRGIPLSFTDTWMIKSKRVKGIKSNL